MPQTGQTITIPRRVYETLTSAFATHEAEWLTRQIRDDPQHRNIMHLGDPFGRVFAWIWNDDPDRAMFFLADYLAALRDHNPVADLTPPVRLDEVLHGLRLAMPDGFGDYDQVVSKARREVQGYYGGDPNA
jgi:hypothetical protein